MRREKAAMRPPMRRAKAREAAGAADDGEMLRSKTSDVASAGRDLSLWMAIAYPWLHGPSVPIAKFVSLCGEPGHEFRDPKDTSKVMMLV